jgi:hypothetical protein
MQIKGFGDAIAGQKVLQSTADSLYLRKLGHVTESTRGAANYKLRGLMAALTLSVHILLIPGTKKEL